MRKLFKTTSLLLSPLFVLSMASGCQSSKSQNSSGQTKTTQKISSFMKYSPGITLTTVRGLDTTSDSIKFPDGEDAENNVMYKSWENNMGIKVKNKILTTPTAVDQKMQLAIASNDIPDFGVVDQTILTSMIKNGLVADQTQYYNQYASKNLKSVLEQSDKALFQPAKKSGKTMALPVVNTIYNNAPVLWVRKDWMQKLNIQEPKTMEDVLATAKAFTTNDPDGNGKKDTYGLYLDKDLDGLNWIMNAYGVYTNAFRSGSTYIDMWLKNGNGEYTSGVTDTKSKDVFAKINELYKAGCIDPEFAVKDASTEDQLVASGKVGMLFGYFYTPLLALQNARKNNPNADWVGFSVPAEKEGSQFVPGVPLNVDGYLYVSKKCAHPEAAAVMMNYLCDGYGAPWLVKNGQTQLEKDYNAAAQNPKYAGKNINNWMPFQMAGNKNWGLDFKTAYESGSKTLEGKQADYSKMIQSDQNAAWGYKKTYLEGYFKADYKTYKYSDYNGASTSTLTKSKSLLDKEQLQTYIAYIMGSKNVNSDFSDFVNRYNNLGASQIGKEIKSELK